MPIIEDIDEDLVFEQRTTQSENNSYYIDVSSLVNNIKIRLSFDDELKDYRPTSYFLMLCNEAEGDTSNKLIFKAIDPKTNEELGLEAIEDQVECICNSILDSITHSRLSRLR